VASLTLHSLRQNEKKKKKRESAARTSITFLNLRHGQLVLGKRGETEKKKEGGLALNERSFLEKREEEAGGADRCSFRQGEGGEKRAQEEGKGLPGRQYLQVTRDCSSTHVWREGKKGGVPGKRGPKESPCRKRRKRGERGERTRGKRKKGYIPTPRIEKERGGEGTVREKKRNKWYTRT